MPGHILGKIVEIIKENEGSGEANEYYIDFYQYQRKTLEAIEDLIDDHSRIRKKLFVEDMQEGSGSDESVHKEEDPKHVKQAELPAPRDEISVVDEQFEKDMNGHANAEHCPEDGITEMPCKLDEMTHLQDRHCHPQVGNSLQANENKKLISEPQVFKTPCPYGTPVKHFNLDSSFDSMSQDSWVLSSPFKCSRLPVKLRDPETNLDLDSSASNFSLGLVYDSPSKYLNPIIKIQDQQVVTECTD